MKLLGKIIIRGTLKTLTGLHIGGSKSSLQIGGIDNNVIKTVQGKPYIPGSSLKGKLRSLLAMNEGSLFFSEKDKATFLKDFKEGSEDYKFWKEKNTDEHEDNDYIVDLFGYSGDTENEEHKAKINHTLLLVRDAYLDNANDAEVFPKEEGEHAYTDSKFENVINRRTGTAEHPRQMERVPVGAAFAFELVYNVFEGNDVVAHLNHIIRSLRLLEDDFIGGQGSRGYGQVKVKVDTEKSVMRHIKDHKYVDAEWTMDGEDYGDFKRQLENI